jgi:puromycin-sensitive aminopeptidase
MKSKFERLPKNVTPKHYDLHLQPDLENFTFDGKLKVDVKVNRNEIYMNSLNYKSLLDCRRIKHRHFEFR